MMGSDAVLKSSHRGAAPVRDVRVRGALLAVWAAATLYLVYVAVHPLKHAPAGAVSPRRGATRQDARHAQASPLAAGAAVNGAVRPAVNWSSIGRNDATSPPEHPKVLPPRAPTILLVKPSPSPSMSLSGPA